MSTPTPWGFKPGGASGGPLSQRQGYVIRPGGHTIETNVEDAALIVKAVNAHQALVDAIQFVLNDAEPGQDAQLTVEGYNRLCAAIALAEEEA